MLADTGEQPAIPRFAIGIRGYDRAEVDAYIEEFGGWVAEERARLEVSRRQFEAARCEMSALRERIVELERELEGRATPTLADLGQEAADIFQNASHVAEELVSGAGEQAAEIVWTAEKRAAALGEDARHDRQLAEEILSRIRSDAEEAAAELRRLAEKEAEDLVRRGEETRRSALSRLEDQRRDVEAEITKLEGRRDAMLDDLERLAGAIATIARQMRSRASTEISLVEHTPTSSPD